MNKKDIETALNMIGECEEFDQLFEFTYKELKSCLTDEEKYEVEEIIQYTNQILGKNEYRKTNLENKLHSVAGWSSIDDDGLAEALSLIILRYYDEGTEDLFESKASSSYMQEEYEKYGISDEEQSELYDGYDD